jgi:hypothetical protein
MTGRIRSREFIILTKGINITYCRGEFTFELMYLSFLFVISLFLPSKNLINVFKIICSSSKEMKKKKKKKKSQL